MVNAHLTLPDAVHLIFCLLKYQMDQNDSLYFLTDRALGHRIGTSNHVVSSGHNIRCLYDSYCMDCTKMHRGAMTKSCISAITLLMRSPKKRRKTGWNALKFLKD